MEAEECPFCDALFTVTESRGGGICGACQEPIDCPHCLKTVRKERTTGVFREVLVRLPSSPVAKYLGLSNDQLEELEIEFIPDTGSSGSMVYSYWFNVPENVSQEILDVTGWKPNQLINGIPAWVVESEE